MQRKWYIVANVNSNGMAADEESEDMKMSVMKKLIAMTLAIIIVMACSVNALACTSLYVGSDLTEDGGTYFSRSEDYSNSYNKVFYVSPAGNHKAGEEYVGCYGFKYTFPKDSYAYTAFRDDNMLGVCPDCDGTHEHTAYEAGGTNEMGVSMTATVSLYSTDEIDEVDPVYDEGIEEAEIVTVVLSQASSADEAVSLLLGLYDAYGAAGGSSIIIGDQNVTWYIENTTGSQYIAMPLPSDMIFINPNVSIVGVIDLDDENIIASEGLIETAQAAGTFVGDADENIIDFRASYSDDYYGSRLVNGLNYLNSAYSYTEVTLPDGDFTISNVKDGEIVELYTNIESDKIFTIQDMVDFYKVDAISRPSNAETHIFQTYADASPETGTVEWVGMDCGSYTVFVPYYPLLTTDTYEAYQLGTEPVEFVTEEPDGSAPYYPTTSWGGEEGFNVQPKNWADSMYWSFDVVSNYVLYVDETQAQTVADAYAALQEEMYDAFDEMKAEAESGEDMQALAASMTETSVALAQKAHETAVYLYETISANQ